jgi:hypothetical protein
MRAGVRRLLFEIFFGFKRNGFRSHFPHFELKNENEQCIKGQRFLTFLGVLSETVFAHIPPVSNKKENERRTLLRAD